MNPQQEPVHQGAGDCNGTEESWGHTWETSATALPVSRGVRPPLPAALPCSCKEGCSQDHLENSNLGSEMTGEKQVETAIASEPVG